MFEQYLKQAWNMLRENKLLSIISIVGTALAICMIMVIVIIYEVNTANIQPEVHRDRTFYISVAESINKSTDRRQSYSFMGLPFIKACFYGLESVEFVTSLSRGGKLYATTMDGNTGSSAEVLFTDGYFWDIYIFDFITGKSFDPSVAEAGVKTIVISETLARSLFGSTDVAGKKMKLNYIVYTISGVVRDVSRYSEKAYADVWVPYNSGGANTTSWCDDINGVFNCCLLLKPGIDKEALRKEVANRVATYNEQTPTFKAQIGNQPFSHLQYWLDGGGGNIFGGDLKQTFLSYGILIIVLLLVPALNLSGITLAQMRKRISELGVRRAFGATTGNIMWQVLSENLLLTLMGGFVGLILSYSGMLLFKDWLLKSSGLTAGMFDPVVFLTALAFCLVMNLLSAGVPAWRVSRVTIVESIKED